MTSKALIRGALAAIGVASLVLGFSTTAVVEAQDETSVVQLRGYPLAIHQGTCDTLVAEPAYELGTLWPRPLLASDTANEETYTVDEFYPDAEADAIGEDTAVLVDDVNDDGIFETGIDLDQDSVLDENEVLARPIVWASENALADLTGVGDAADDAELTDLRDTPHAVVVHRNDITDTNYLACGEIEGVVGDEGNLIVVLQPLASNGFIGLAELQESESGFLGIGGDGGAADVYVWPSRGTAEG